MARMKRKIAGTKWISLVATTLDVRPPERRSFSVAGAGSPSELPRTTVPPLEEAATDSTSETYVPGELD
jgi:hypothetical protein